MLRPCMVIPTLASDGFQLDNGHMMMPWSRDQLKMAFLGKVFVPGKKKYPCGEFPGGSVVRTCCFHCHGLGSIPGWGTKILQAKINK